MQEYIPEKLPVKSDLETKKVLKQLTVSHRYLAELKGISAIIPNETILIDTLSLQEAKQSSAIENIITTNDELYKSFLFDSDEMSLAAKEVKDYAEALKYGFSIVKEKEQLTINDIIKIQQILEKNDAGFRKLPGTELKNVATGETVYTPPQNYSTIIDLMSNLELFINDNSYSNLDPLIKMAVIHYQFESIHPFYDGNGRTGRIINILYLVLLKLLNIPVLYLSRYIINNKKRYYNLLQQVRLNGEWEEWILFLIKGVEVTSKETIYLVSKIRDLMQEYKILIRTKFPMFYSQDLLNNLFKHPYTKVDFLMNDIGVSRITAQKYLDILASETILEKRKIWKSYYYVNHKLFNLIKGSESSFLDDQIITIHNKP